MTTARDVGFVEMRIAKVVGLPTAEGEMVLCVVLDEVTGTGTFPYVAKRGWRTCGAIN